jgi:hypothetical protein
MVIECVVNEISQVDNEVASSDVQVELDVMLSTMAAPFSLVDGDEVLARCMGMEMNHTRKALCHIAGYYGIGQRRRSKSEIALDIVMFEANVDNVAKVADREECWRALELVRSDAYMRKHVVMI